jgi:hypothetical protein
MKLISKKGTVEFSWIFALIVGGSILFLAFFFVGQQFFQQKQLAQIQTTQTIDVLLTPFSSSGNIANAQEGVIKLQKNSDLNLYCEKADNFNPLGYESLEIIPLDTKKTLTSSGTNNAVSEKKIYDKYIFGEDFTTKEILTFSKPFNAPWRIADMVYIFPYENNYCFYGTSMPSRIKKELISLDNSSSLKHFLFDNEDEENDYAIKADTKCAKNICFNHQSGITCDITIIPDNTSPDYLLGEIKKENGINTETTNYYSDALLYASIFSDKETYECNIQRIFSRAQIQIEIYNAKNLKLQQKQCQIIVRLNQISSTFEGLKNEITSENFKSLKLNIASIETQNNNAISQDCGLY